MPATPEQLDAARARLQEIRGGTNLDLARQRLREIQAGRTVAPLPKGGLVRRGLRGLQKIGETAFDVETGIFKGLASTLGGAATLGEQIISFGQTRPETTAGRELQERVQPVGTAQEIGFGAEQIAELLLPVPGLQAAKGVGIARAGAEVARRAPQAISGLTARGTRLAGRAATEGAEFAGRLAVQRGDITEVGAEAKFAAAVPIAGAAARTVARPVSKALGGTAERVINSLIKPLQRDFSFGKNPGRGVAREGIVANTFDDLLRKLTVTRQSLGAQIGEQLAKSKKRVSLLQVLNPIDEALTKAKVAPKLNAPIINRLNAAKSDLTNILRQTGKPGNLTPQQAFEFKQAVSNLTQFTDVISDAPVNKALKQVYGRTKGVINDVAPKVKTLNERFADIRSAEIATIHRDKILARQNVLPFATKIGGIAGGASVAGLPGALVGVVLAGVAEKALGSVAFKTRVAAMLSRMSGQQIRTATQNPAVKQALERIFGGADEVSEIIKNPGVVAQF